MSKAMRKTDKIKVFITIDTEDKYFDVPRLITGEGLAHNPGIHMMMDILEQYHCKGNFFLNVYEHINYKENVLKNIAAGIFERGHAIELHTHPNEKSQFYKRPIYVYPLEQQINILEYGKKLIYDWTGTNPVAHRGGAYACNNDTLTALDKIGIPIDSSLWLNNVNNIMKKYYSINRIALYNNTIEVPVTYVDKIKSDGRHSDSKFDVDWLNAEDLIKVVEQAKKQNLKVLTLFLHSFSFIEKINKDVSENNHPKAKFISSPVWGKTCAQIIGFDESKVIRLKKILEYIRNDEDIEVLTFQDWYNKGINLGDLGEDYIPVV